MAIYISTVWTKEQEIQLTLDRSSFLISSSPTLLNYNDKHISCVSWACHLRNLIFCDVGIEQKCIKEQVNLMLYPSTQRYSLVNNHFVTLPSFDSIFCLTLCKYHATQAIQKCMYLAFYVLLRRYTASSMRFWW